MTWYTRSAVAGSVMGEEKGMILSVSSFSSSTFRIAYAATEGPTPKKAKDTMVFPTPTDMREFPKG